MKLHISLRSIHPNLTAWVLVELPKKRINWNSETIFRIFFFIFSTFYFNDGCTFVIWTAHSYSQTIVWMNGRCSNPSEGSLGLHNDSFSICHYEFDMKPKEIGALVFIVVVLQPTSLPYFFFIFRWKYRYGGISKIPHRDHHFERCCTLKVSQSIKISGIVHWIRWPLRLI